MIPDFSLCENRLRNLWVRTPVLGHYDKNGKAVIPYKFVVQLRRWVVERTIGWMSNFRALSKDYDMNVRTGEANILLISIFYLSRRLTEPPQIKALCANNFSEVSLARMPGIYYAPEWTKTCYTTNGMKMVICRLCGIFVSFVPFWFKKDEPTKHTKET